MVKSSDILNASVLIVDDLNANIRLLERILHGAGYTRVASTMDPLEVCELYRKHRYDLILLDLQMPGMDGFEVMAGLKEIETDGYLPVLVITAQAGHKLPALQSGAKDFISKPFDRIEVLTRIHNMLEIRLLHKEARNYGKVLEQTVHERTADLRESEEAYRTLVESVRAIVWRRGARSDRFAFVSKQAEQILGYPAEHWISEPGFWQAHIHPDDRNRVIAFCAQATARLEAHELDYRMIAADGRTVWLHDFVKVSVENGQPDELFGVMVDLTDQKQAEEKLARDVTERKLQELKFARLNRVLSVLSGINSAIVRVRNRQELFAETCRIAVEQGGLGLAWIGVFDPQTLDMTPVAWAGFDAEQLVIVGAKVTARSDVPQGSSVMARAIREKKPVFSNDITAEPSVGGKRRQEVLRRGYRSVIVLPLTVAGDMVGTFSLFAKEPGFFDEDERKLLTELAGNISFALENNAKGERLDYLAYYDALTGMPNRALFHERLGHQLRVAGQKGTKVALVLCDVRRFRFINESLGRHAGDALLRQIAARSKELWPDLDNVARISADCFAGALVDLKDEAEIAHVLERALTKVTGSPFKIEKKELTISTTAGIAVFPADGADADILYRNAEAALKKAKASGEPYLFYRSQMNATVAQTLLLENKMRRALDRQEFVLHYQPKVDLAKGTISGLEALIRWNDPETGLVPPMQFIPLLEETGMILEAGRWAIRKALEDRREWCRQGLQPPRIAVNVSPIQIRQKDFVGVVRDAITELEAGSAGLDLEITESLIMEDIEGNIEKLRAIADMGVNIAIDDFGTGYSSLAYLAKLPIDALKIDRSFIITMTADPASMTIVSATISLAHALDLKVIAEGVETEEQSKYLMLLRCDEIQGYLIGKPMPAIEISKLLASGVERPAPAASGIPELTS